MMDLSAEPGVLLCTIQTPDGAVGVFRVKDSDERRPSGQWMQVHETMMDLPGRGRALYFELGVLKDKRLDVELDGGKWEPGELDRYTELRRLEERDLRASRYARYVTALGGCRVWVDDGGSGFFGVTLPQHAELQMTRTGETMDKAEVTLDIGMARPEFLSRVYPVWEETAASAKSARDFRVSLPEAIHPGRLTAGSGPLRPGRQAVRPGTAVRRQEPGRSRTA